MSTTWTSAFGRGCGVLLDAIVRWLALAQINPNVLTFLGLVVNTIAAFLFGYANGDNQARMFRYAGLVIIASGFFDLVDGRVARASNQVTRFGGFFDSVIDRYSDASQFFGLLVFFARGDRFFYVVLTAFVMVSSIMVSYTRARAESLISKCKVGFMERPERIVLFMIGAITNRMAGVLWVVLVLSILAVHNRIYYTYLALNGLPMPSKEGVKGTFNRAFFWTDERATAPYDIWVIAILAFVWLIPPDWLGDPMAHDPGLVAWIGSQF
jgi:CDP-diacylglycerol--glycerol-3-phosphate 3-phosphatidyltransferase